jgi:transcriptional regulator with XRE-family HTH domain
MLLTIIFRNLTLITIVAMKSSETAILSPALRAEALQVGERIARMRRARKVLQAEAAVRAGLSRPTASRIEAGDPGRTLGQVLRYLDAIAPGMTLLELLQGTDPSLISLAESEKTQRVRKLSTAELKRLDF